MCVRHTARTLEPRWIPGAIHVPLEDVGRHLGHLPRDRDIILYCTCPSEASAARVAKMLINHGFKKVRPLYGGLDAWIAAGYAVATVTEAARERIAAHHVVIVGAGFGGLAVAQGLARRRLCASPSSISATIICFSRCSTKSARRRSRPRKSPGRSVSSLRKRKDITTLLGAVAGVDTAESQGAARGRRARSATTRWCSRRARATPTSATTSGSRMRRGSRRWRMQPRSGAACCFPSSAPSARPMRHAAARCSPL